MTQLCEASPTLLKRRHFDGEIIMLCVRWDLTDKLSSRDLKAMMAERGIDVAHTTIMRWVPRYVPEFEKQWQRYARSVGTSWRVDETYIKIRGKWAYLYRCVDKEGQSVDFLLRAHRDIAAAKRFFAQVVAKRGVPKKSTLDGYAASHAAVAELQEAGVLSLELIVRTNRHLNNGIEPDHRRVNQRVRPMRGCKRFEHAAITSSGIELVHQIKKGQFDTFGLCAPRARTPQGWDSGLAA